MQRKLILKYILDIESVIEEIEMVRSGFNEDFNKFETDIISQRAIERQLSIIGEAMNKMKKIDRNIEISGVKHIIGLRNLIIHSYDAVEPEMLWSIIHRDIPILKKEISNLK